MRRLLPYLLAATCASVLGPACSSGGGGGGGYYYGGGGDGAGAADLAAPLDAAPSVWMWCGESGSKMGGIVPWSHMCFTVAI